MLKMNTICMKIKKICCESKIKNDGYIIENSTDMKYFGDMDINGIT